MIQEFSYLAPDNLNDLCVILKQNADTAMVMAGGTDIMVGLHNNWIAPKTLIDIKKVKQLNGIDFDPEEGLSIGATTTCIDLIENKDAKKYYPLLTMAAYQIGSPQLRNRATIAGNLCTASPCADMGCSLLSLGAEIELCSVDGFRVVALKDFFTGPKKTQIRAYEVVTRIIVPADMVDAKFGMRKLKRIKGHDLALVSVAMARTDKVMRAGIGSCAATPVVTADLKADASLETVKTAVDKVIAPIDDIRASAEYRQFMAHDYVEKIYAELF